MSRTKTGVVRRRSHKKVLAQTKGFRGANTRLYKRAHEALLHAGQYAYIGRKLRKRNFRQLWIIRLNAAVHEVEPGLNYSRLINLLKKKEVRLDRRMLAHLAVNDFEAFRTIVKTVSS